METKVRNDVDERDFIVKLYLLHYAVQNVQNQTDIKRLFNIHAFVLVASAC